MVVKKYISSPKNLPIIIFAAMSLVMFFLPVHFVKAVSFVTGATGGTQILADTAGGDYTPIIGPVISQIKAGDIKKGTIILTVPSGFVFDTDGIAPVVLVTRTGGSGADSRNINGLASGSMIPVTGTSTQ